MKKSKVLLCLTLGIIIGVLACLAVYFVTRGDEAWEIYLEEKLIPNAVLAITTLLGLLIGAQPMIKGVSNIISGFALATKRISDTSDKDSTLVEDMREKYNMLEKKLDREHTELCELKQTVSKTNDILKASDERIEKMLHIGFCNTDELVKKGYAREIAKVGENNEPEKA